MSMKSGRLHKSLAEFLLGAPTRIMGGVYDDSTVDFLKNL